MKSETEVLSFIKSGDKIKINYGKGNINNKLLHIISIIVEGNDTIFVVKCWSKHKQRWRYWVEHICYFQVNFEHISHK